MWCLIVSIPDLCPLPYFEAENPEKYRNMPILSDFIDEQTAVWTHNINSTDCMCVSTVLSNAILPNLYALAHLPDVICRDSSRLTKILHSYTIIILIVKMLC